MRGVDNLRSHGARDDLGGYSCDRPTDRRVGVDNVIPMPTQEDGQVSYGHEVRRGPDTTLHGQFDDRNSCTRGVIPERCISMRLVSDARTGNGNFAPQLVQTRREFQKVALGSSDRGFHHHQDPDRGRNVQAWLTGHMPPETSDASRAGVGGMSSGKIVAGFMIPCGSRARLIWRIVSSAAPCSRVM